MPEQKYDYINTLIAEKEFALWMDDHHYLPKHGRDLGYLFTWIGEDGWAHVATYQYLEKLISRLNKFGYFIKSVPSEADFRALPAAHTFYCWMDSCNVKPEGNDSANFKKWLCEDFGAKAMIGTYQNLKETVALLNDERMCYNFHIVCPSEAEFNAISGAASKEQGPEKKSPPRINKKRVTAHIPQIGDRLSLGNEGGEVEIVVSTKRSRGPKIKPAKNEVTKTIPPNEDSPPQPREVIKETTDKAAEKNGNPPQNPVPSKTVSLSQALKKIVEHVKNRRDENDPASSLAAFEFKVPIEIVAQAFDDWAREIKSQSQKSDAAILLKWIREAEGVEIQVDNYYRFQLIGIYLNERMQGQYKFVIPSESEYKEAFGARTKRNPINPPKDFETTALCL
jgi:hypothetical protein